MGELDKTIAVVFKRGGKNVMSEMEFVNNVIFNFRYSGTKEGFKLDARKAQQVMDAGLAKDLLKKENGMVKPTFDYREFEVPMNYKPTEAILLELVNEAVPQTGGHRSVRPRPSSKPHHRRSNSQRTNPLRRPPPHPNRRRPHLPCHNPCSPDWWKIFRKRPG